MPEELIRKTLREATLHNVLGARALRLGPEQDGRAAGAGRRGRVPAQPAGHAARGRREPQRRKTPRSAASRKPDEPFCGLVFKIVADSHGDLHYVRVYSGRLKANSRVLNPGKDKKENVPQLWRIQADEREAGRCGRSGRHHRRHRPAALRHRRHALRRPRADPAGIDPVSRDGHLDGHRAGKLDRAEEAGRRAGHDEAAGPYLRAPAKTRRPARRSSAAWASCTWRSSSTACSATTSSTFASISRG